MSAEPSRRLAPSRPRRLVILGLLRALLIASALVAAYYVAPLHRLTDVPLGFVVAVGVLALTVSAVLQVRAIVRAPYPAIRAIEGFTVTASLFVVLFAATYTVMAQADPANFNVHTLSRTDAIYLTVTILTTVGFGDITATSQAARVMVTAQMILDLVVLGLGIRVFVGAVQVGRQKTRPAADPSPWRPPQA